MRNRSYEAILEHVPSHLRRECDGAGRLSEEEVRIDCERKARNTYHRQDDLRDD